MLPGGCTTLPARPPGRRGVPALRRSLPVVRGQEWGHSGRSLTVTFCPGRHAQLTPLERQVAVTDLYPEGEKWLLFYHLRLYHESKGISCSSLSNLSTVLTSKKKKKRTKERYYLMATKYLNQGHQPTAEPKRADGSQHEVGRAHSSLIITTGKRTGFWGETVVFIDP